MIEDRFTAKIREVMKFAREETLSLQNDFIGTEHILLGLLREGTGDAAKVISNLGLDIETVIQKVRSATGKATWILGSEIGEISLNKSAERALELSSIQAGVMGSNFVGTAHLLLGLLQEKKGLAYSILSDLGLSYEKVQREFMRLLKNNDSSLEV
jgi:ATP-dependent Clp protease ATP-binding subunit ClpC